MRKRGKKRSVDDDENIHETHQRIDAFVNRCLGYSFDTAGNLCDYQFVESGACIQDNRRCSSISIINQIKENTSKKNGV